MPSVALVDLCEINYLKLEDKEDFCLPKTTLPKFSVVDRVGDRKTADRSWGTPAQPRPQGS